MNKNRVWFMALVAALGGFLFGFDTIVINGAEPDIQRLWNLSGTMHGWVVSSALWGTVAGALAGGWISGRFRAQGQALGASTHWVFAALVALFFPVAAERFAPAVIFGFFGVMMVFHLLWVVFAVRETKGRALEDIA